MMRAHLHVTGPCIAGCIVTAISLFIQLDHPASAPAHGPGVQALGDLRICLADGQLDTRCGETLRCVQDVGAGCG